MQNKDFLSQSNLFTGLKCGELQKLANLYFQVEREHRLRIGEEPPSISTHAGLTCSLSHSYSRFLESPRIEILGLVPGHHNSPLRCEILPREKCTSLLFGRSLVPSGKEHRGGLFAPSIALEKAHGAGCIGKWGGPTGAISEMSG